MVLKKIVVSLCMADMEINGTVFKQGYTYEFEAIIIGVTIKAGISVSWNGFSAYFGMTRVQFIPGVLEVCKNHFCRANEGPMASIEMRLIPPKFRLELAAYANVFGLKFGASLVVEWLGIGKDFKANFSAYPLDLKVLKILKSKYDHHPGPGGPNCGFDSSKMRLWLSGRVEFLLGATDCWVEVSPTRFLINIERELWVFYFAVRLEGQLGGRGLGSITISMEAGNRAGSDIRTKIRDAVHKKIDEWERAGTEAINKAQAGVSNAQGEVTKAINKIQDAKNALENKKRDVDKWKNCGGEELLLLQKKYDKGRPERLRRWRVKRASLIADWRKKRTRELQEKLRAYDAHVFEESEPDALEDVQSSARAKHGVQSRNKMHQGVGWHRWHWHIPHRWHHHWGGIGKFFVDAGKAIYKHVIKPVVNAACWAAAEVAKLALSAAQGVLTVVQGALHGVNAILEAAKGVLELAKITWKGVWAIIKGLVSAVLGITYVKIWATLSLNLLDTCIGGELKYDLGGNKLHLRGEFCLKNLFKIIGDLFKACLKALTGWAEEQEEELFQIEQHEVEEYGKQLDLQFEVTEVENLPDITDLKMVFQPMTNQSNNTNQTDANQTADLYTMQGAGAVNNENTLEEMLIARGR